MQQPLTPQQLSRYRQQVRRLIQDIDHLASRCLFIDSLIQGNPGEVFRTCGKESCKCMKSKADRHGPYLVIQIYREGKQRQIAVKRDDKRFWDKAKHYQFQLECLGKLKQGSDELQRLVVEIIERRLEEFPK